MTTPYSLFHAFLPIAQKMEEFTNRQLVVLLHLFIKGGEVDYGDLAKAMKFPKPAITRASNQLCTSGYAIRTRDLEDRRFIWLAITPAGKAFVQKLCGVA